MQLQGSKGDAGILDTAGEGEDGKIWREGEDGKIWKNSTETYTLPRVKQTASGSSMYDVGTQSRHSVATWRMGWAGGGAVQEGVTHIHLMPVHVDTRQKPSRYCKVIIL